MRVSCVLCSSPRQYAPARPVSLNALIGFEFCRCGPRQRSVNVALGVERDVALGGVDELDLVRLALRLEARAAPRRARSPRALHSRPSVDLALHLVLDPLEVGLGDRLRELEVVVEAVLDRRADRDLDARVEPPHRLGEQVRRRVAQHVERVGVVACRGWSGTGCARRRRAAGAGRAARRRRGRARPARRASGRSRARRRGRSRRREVRALSCREGRRAWKKTRLITPVKTTGTKSSTSRRSPTRRPGSRQPRMIRGPIRPRAVRRQSPARGTRVSVVVSRHGRMLPSKRISTHSRRVVVGRCRETSTKPAFAQPRTAVVPRVRVDGHAAPAGGEQRPASRARRRHHPAAARARDEEAVEPAAQRLVGSHHDWR